MIDNKKVITGSFNWSPAAAHTNDETLLVIESPKLAAHLTQEMDRMWRGAELGITPRIKRKLDRQTRKNTGVGWREAEWLQKWLYGYSVQSQGLQTNVANSFDFYSEKLKFMQSRWNTFK